MQFEFTPAQITKAAGYKEMKEIIRLGQIKLDMIDNFVFNQDEIELLERARRDNVMPIEAVKAIRARIGMTLAEGDACVKIYFSKNPDGPASDSPQTPTDA